MARASVATNAALAQTLAGDGYREFLAGDAPVFVEPVGAAANVALERTLAGAGYLEFQPGESRVATIRASIAVVGVGLREYLDGEGPFAALPLPAPANQPAP